VSSLTRQNAFTRAFEFSIKSEVRGDYFEFGTYQGASLGNAIKSFDKLKSRYNYEGECQFYGFDSFEGLPELTSGDELESYEAFSGGQYTCSEDQVRQNVMSSVGPGVSLELIPGFYSKSLSDPKVLERFCDKKAAVVHIDCDLYSSAVDCLKFIDDKYSDGTLIMFDDWFCFRGRKDSGVQKAFYEWVSESDVVYSEYFRYAWSGICFILNR